MIETAVGRLRYLIKGLNVSADNTTKVDASLEEALVTKDEIVVTAKKPVLDVNLTSTVATISDNDIKMLPVQELQDIVNLQAGVVDGHFRGGRDDEVQYQVNGVSVNNSYDNKSSVKIDRSLIQEVQVITGGFDAEYGQAMSGVVNTVLKSGGDHFEWNAEALTGDFLYSSGGARNLTYKFHPGGTQNYQFSINGPTGLPQTYFLVNARRYWFDDYFYGVRLFNPTDTTNLHNQDQSKWLLNPNGDGKEVPMGYSHEWSGLARITNRSISGVELSYQALFNIIDARKLDNAFTFRFNPDGKTVQKTVSVVQGLDWTHTLSSSTFYTINVRENYFDYTDWVYDNFYDPRYDIAQASKNLFGFAYDASVAGVDLGRFRQKTNSLVLKGALTSQVTRDHQVKVGGELELSNMQYGTPGTLAYLPGGTAGELVLYRFLDSPPDYPGVQTYKPVTMAAYGQDQIEWNDLTIRAGLRFDFFNPRSSLPSDPGNPANNIQGAPPSPPRKASIKTSLAPRLGISYPITVRSSVFFSYGHFYQLPALKDIFDNSNYNKLARFQASDTYKFGTFGNPDVRPERTVQYEVGYKNAVTDFLGISVNVFYKDIRDLLGVEFVQTYNDAEYPRITNVDFGNTAGFTISIDQRRLGIFNSTVDYTWQMAQGNSSDPRETATRAQAGQDPRPRQVPLNWDQRHTLNLTLQISKPDNYSVSTIVRFGSGQPYTPEVTSAHNPAIETNSDRKPDGLVVDLRAEKNFVIAGLNMSLFARVFNLLNTTYFNGDVFASTGSPDYSLFPLSKDRDKLADPTRFYAPRRFEIGISTNSSF